MSANYPTRCKDARALGSKYYFTGKPCPVGHIALRWTSTQGCVQCAKRHQVRFLSTEAGRASVRATQKKYYHANKEKRRRALLRWQQKNREHCRAKCREWAKTEFGRRWRLVHEAKRRKAVIRARTAFGQEGVKEFYASAKRLGLQVDHIVPIRHPLVCGLHNIFNLQMLPAGQNISKHNRWLPTEETYG